MPKTSEKPALELSQPVIVIVGPTASGKTDVAQEIARRANGEVVSADSMQIYEGMDIGTGKLPAAERIVPHWGFDIRKPGEAYSASLREHVSPTSMRAASDACSRAARGSMYGPRLTTTISRRASR